MSVSSSPRIRRGPTPLIKRRRRHWLKRAAPMLARIFVIVIALTIGSLLVWRGMRPLRLVSHEQRERDRIVAEYNALRKQNEDLRRQLSYLRTPKGVARQARKQGFVKPGEISLVIPEPKRSRASDD